MDPFLCYRQRNVVAVLLWVRQAEISSLDGVVVGGWDVPTAVPTPPSDSHPKLFDLLDRGDLRLPSGLGLCPNLPYFDDTPAEPPQLGKRRVEHLPVSPFKLLSSGTLLSRGVQSLYIFDFRQNRCSAPHETPESPTSRFSCTGHNSIFYGVFDILEKNFAYGKLHVKMEIRNFNSLTPTI